MHSHGALGVYRVAVAVFAVMIIGLTGCVGSRPASIPPPESLVEVNRRLAGREARVLLDDSTVVAGTGAAVFPDSVRFAGGEDAVPTDRVRRITYERDSFSPGQGASVGAVVGFSLLGIVMVGGDADPVDLAAGIGAAGAASLIGLLLGLAEQVGEQERVAYEGPLSRYGRSAAE